MQMTSRPSPRRRPYLCLQKIFWHVIFTATSVLDDKWTGGMKEDSERGRTNEDTSNATQYELLNALSSQNSNAGPIYAQLTTSTNVDISDITGQSLSDRATYLQLTYEESL